jgi:hypothetical protein
VRKQDKISGVSSMLVYEKSKRNLFMINKINFIEKVLKANINLGIF